MEKIGKHFVFCDLVVVKGEVNAEYFDSVLGYL